MRSCPRAGVTCLHHARVQSARLYIWLQVHDFDKQTVKGVTIVQVEEDGIVFFRESCFRQSGDKARKSNPTHYRCALEYLAMRMSL